MTSMRNHRSPRLRAWPFSYVFALSFTIVGASAFAGTPAPSDAEVEEAIETEYLLNRMVDENDLTTEVIEGVVTLSGEVDHLLEQELAVDIAHTVKGVRSIVDDTTIRPSDRRDIDVAKDIRESLRRDSAATSYEINVAVLDGIVTLTGEVDSYQESQLAENVAKRVNGVMAVDNDLTWDVDMDRADTAIAAEVRAVLESNVWIDDGLIDVAVSDNTVYLSGSVSSWSELNRAMMASWVAGVDNVITSELEIDSWARDDMQRKDKYAIKTDAQLASAVDDALLYDPRVLAANIDVDVDAGDVTLRGYVDNLAAKRAAASDARNTVGVGRVINLIKVDPASPYDDEAIADSIETAFTVNPWVSNYDVDVTAIDGTVYLSGDVSTDIEKREAEYIASTQAGVKRVRNLITTNEWEWDYQRDLKIENEINDQLFWSVFVDSDEVDVAVDDGIATLSGEVDTVSEMRSAVDNAYEGGARRVINKLDVAMGDSIQSYDRTPLFRDLTPWFP